MLPRHVANNIMQYQLTLTNAFSKMDRNVWSTRRVIGISGSLVNFGEVRRAQLAKSTLLTSTIVPLGSIKSPVKLQSWFLSLRGKTCLRQNCSLDSCTSSEGPVLGQNTLMMLHNYKFCKNINCEIFLISFIYVYVRSMYDILFLEVATHRC